MESVTGLAGFRGTLIRPDDPEYDEARRLWNGAIDRRPALIARCADEQDAAIALADALAEGLPVAVRGGGHNVSGSALCDGGVVIRAAHGGRYERLARTKARFDPNNVFRSNQNIKPADANGRGHRARE